MPRAKAGDRILGPYREENGRWRVIVIRAGERTSETYSTQGEAEEAIEGARSELKHTTPLTVAEAIDEHVCWLKKQGRKEITTKPRKRRLARFFGPHMDQPLTSLTTRRCQKLYDDLSAAPNQRRKIKQPIVAATHQYHLRIAQGFLRWAVEQHLLTSSPLDAVKPQGVVSRGKTQLRIDEARIWTSKATELAHQGDMGAIAALTAFLLGLRASEVLGRVVRDLDNQGQLLWIPTSKTKHGIRQVEVPVMLQPYLIQLTRNKQPSDPLFPMTVDHPVPWLFRQTRRICRLAGVTRVSTHSLRGLHSTLAVRAGATSHLVAASLGHGTDAVTRAHYIAPGTIEAANQATVLNVLNPSSIVPNL